MVKSIFTYSLLNFCSLFLYKIAVLQCVNFSIFIWTNNSPSMVENTLLPFRFFTEKSIWFGFRVLNFVNYYSKLYNHSVESFHNIIQTNFLRERMKILFTVLGLYQIVKYFTWNKICLSVSFQWALYLFLFSWVICTNILEIYVNCDLNSVQQFGFAASMKIFQ